MNRQQAIEEITFWIEVLQEASGDLKNEAKDQDTIGRLIRCNSVISQILSDLFENFEE